ncbi:MAG: DUF5710 domain-containing protein [Methylococcaceae bacterium]|nr:DUF5710 domain-containing protein [Methylococcaceae bacterium]
MVNSKIYLNVPYAEKDAAKALGAKWDATKKKWYVPMGTEVSPFLKWSTETVTIEKKTKSENSKNNSFSGITTFPKNKAFIAYSGKLPPWD